MTAGVEAAAAAVMTTTTRTTRKRGEAAGSSLEARIEKNHPGASRRGTL